MIPGLSTALLHGVMGVLTALISLTFLISYKVSAHAVSKKLAFFFLFFTLYSLSVTTAIIVFPGNMVVASWGMLVGLYFVLLVILMGFDTPLFYKHVFFEKNAGRIRLLFALLWGFFSLWGILFPQESFVGAGNFVYWNFNLICAWGLSFLCIIAALTWGYIYSEGTHYVDKGHTEAYVKTRTFAVDGIIWGIAGPSYIISAGLWWIIAAFILMIFSFIVTAGIFAYFRFWGIEQTPNTL
jgi:hypothetical protein